MLHWTRKNLSENSGVHLSGGRGAQWGILCEHVGCSILAVWTLIQVKMNTILQEKWNSSHGEKYKTKVVGNGSSYCSKFQTGMAKNIHFFVLFVKLAQSNVFGHNCFIFLISSKWKKFGTVTWTIFNKHNAQISDQKYKICIGNLEKTEWFYIKISLFCIYYWTAYRRPQCGVDKNFRISSDHSPFFAYMI